MLCCSIWFSAPSFWMGGGLESRCVGRVYGADCAVHGSGTIHQVDTSVRICDVTLIVRVCLRTSPQL